ncbi:MAG TPA: FAD/NAD(P)-binding oxidoreductase [Blastocatellia bacterium]|nr:FAD/NAD(P)-binding oxidoreductase [Blastocatellia bacterium]
MNKTRHDCEVLVVGGGPAGMAAAGCIAQSGHRVAIVDDNPAPGGQIWRGEQKGPTTSEAGAWFRRLEQSGLEFIAGASVFAQSPGRLLAETWDGVREIRYQKLILATGARERFLPFPNWTLPGVTGAGGLQALVKSGLTISGRRVVIAGSGPLLLAVAAYLRRHGAEILLIAEQASWNRLIRFGLELGRQPARIAQAFGLKRQLAGIRYLTGCWPTAAQGGERLASVTLRRGGRAWEVECDYLGCGFYLVPNLELPSLFGCQVQDGAVVVDQYQETSISGLFCAGEATGIGGLELSLIEGQIAGYAAVGRHDQARRLFSDRAGQRRFARVLNRTFALRDELKSLPRADTLVCRCEDVTYERARPFTSWRAAKLQARYGMGPCQGRICGAAARFLFGWGMESVRPPILPARLENLTQLDDQSTE